MRGALVIGIDHYEHMDPLSGCAYDAEEVERVLASNGDGSRNFDVAVLTSTGPTSAITRTELRDNIRLLFESDDLETAVLYFAGHGALETLGGYLLASDSRSEDDGVSLLQVVKLANESPARHKVIVLDSCFSGSAGANPYSPQRAELGDGTTILAASSAKQGSEQPFGAGVFTSLFVHAMEGAAANLLGEISPGSVYAHIDQSLGWWAQRPVLKTNVKSFVCLRKVRPAVERDDLRAIREFFPSEGYMFPLDPCYEPEGPCPDPDKNRKFAILQKLNRVNLVVPVDAPHMWHAAMWSTGCRLTALGEHYRRLVGQRRI
jgi:hypothetical protein